MHARMAAAMAIAAGLGAGCPSVGAFECFGPADCDRAPMGECLAGACAYPDPDCGSGLAWSPNAANDASACVDAATGTSSGSTATVTTSASTSESVTSSSTTAEPSTSSSGPAPTCGFTKAIDIDTTVFSPTAALADYPLLLAFSDPDLVDADPDALFFTASDDTPLPHELESLDAATGALVAWVRLPEWTVGESITVLLAVGDDARPSQPGQVWAPSYVGVWHLGDALDDSEGEVIRNAVAGGEHGFAYGNLGADQSVAGAIGSALLFDGSDDYVEVSGGFVGTLQAFTVSYWARWDGDVEQGGFFGRLNGEPLFPRCWKIDATGTPYCQLYSSGEVVGAGGDPEDTAPGELVHMALSWDGAVMTVFFAGAIEAANTMYPGTMPGGDQSFVIGNETEFDTFNGLLDEFRVSDRALPPEWIEADFRTQSNPGNAILAIGAAEPRPCE